MLSPEPRSNPRIAESIEQVNQFAAKLASLPIGARTVLAIIISRGDLARSGHWDTEITIRYSLLKYLVDCSEPELVEHLEVVDHAGFGRLEQPFESEPFEYQLCKSTGDLGWHLFSEIRTLAGDDRNLVRRIVVDIDFSPFDSV